MAEDAGQAQAAEALLKDAALFYERHQAGRSAPFNVFTVLRSESDEVNLHSRFLAALLDHRKAPDAPRANLEDFLIVVGCDDFDLDGATVERERDRIDILLTNTAGQAVVIENKIWASDQQGQLWRYYKSLKERGFEGRNIRLLYLTLDSHEPEEHSIYDEDCEDRVPEDRLCLISYAHTLPPWLERCQGRAYAEPGLRESIEQYLNLVRKMTGTDQGREYMRELKKLCMQGDNPRLIHDLTEALINVKIDLLIQLCEGIEDALKERALEERIDLQPRTEWSDISRNKINGYLRRERGRGDFGLYWPLEGYPAHLGVAILAHEIMLGIRCSKGEYPKEYARFEEMARNKGMQVDRWGWWPCWKRSDLLPENFNRENLSYYKWEHVEYLQKQGKDLAKGIAEDLKRVWDTVRKNTSSPA